MQIPVALPPGVDPEIAKKVIELLKQNPEAAEQSYMQAQKLMQKPGMAQSVLAQQKVMQSPQYQQQLSVLKDDPGEHMCFGYCALPEV